MFGTHVLLVHVQLAQQSTPFETPPFTFITYDALSIRFAPVELLNYMPSIGAGVNESDIQCTRPSHLGPKHNLAPTSWLRAVSASAWCFPRPAMPFPQTKPRICVYRFDNTQRSNHHIRTSDSVPALAAWDWPFETHLLLLSNLPNGMAALSSEQEPSHFVPPLEQYVEDSAGEYLHLLLW